MSAADGVPVVGRDHPPSPSAFPARTCTSYWLSVVNPVSVAVRAVLSSAAFHSVHSVAVDSLYCTS